MRRQQSSSSVEMNVNLNFCSKKKNKKTLIKHDDSPVVLCAVWCCEFWKEQPTKSETPTKGERAKRNNRINFGVFCINENEFCVAAITKSIQNRWSGRVCCVHGTRVRMVCVGPSKWSCSIVYTHKIKCINFEWFNIYVDGVQSEPQKQHGIFSIGLLFSSSQLHKY